MIRFGVLGTGNIARQFAAGVAGAERCRITAVASRSLDSSQAFASAFGIPGVMTGYDSLLACGDVDAVYISLPNTLHHRWAIEAMRSGKHVLCEKPLAANATEAKEMFAVARETRRVLVEAFMYIPHPQTQAVLQAVRSGAIGQVKLVRSSFCYRTRRVEGNIRFDPSLAGGSLMDIGCYCLTFSQLVAGDSPTAVHCVGHLHPGGVDDVAAGTLLFPSGIVGSFTCGMSLQVDNSAYIAGDEGYIEIPVPWKPAANGAVFHIGRGTPPKMDSPKPGMAAPPSRETRTVSAGKDLYAVEADAFASIILDGVPSFMPETLSIRTMECLDDLRRQIHPASSGRSGR